MRLHRLVCLPILIVLTGVALTGCEHVTKPKEIKLPPPPGPWNVVQRLIVSYEQKKTAEYPGCFTGDFTYEFSNSTDPVLVQHYATGWFKEDERRSSSHLFNG